MEIMTLIGNLYFILVRDRVSSESVIAEAVYFRTLDTVGQMLRQRYYVTEIYELNASLAKVSYLNVHQFGEVVSQ